MSDTPDLRMLGERESGAGEEQDLSAFVKDTSPEVTPATFDSGAFLAGVRPTRRSVQIVERADLLGDMERLAQLYGEADDADDDEACERLHAEFEQVAERFHGSKRWYTVEKRSSEWIEKFRKDTAEEHGLDVGKTGERTDDPDRVRDRMTLVLHQLAAQIVSPAGTTYDDLVGLYDRNEGELNKLLLCMEFANTRTAESAKVAAPGFSLRRSASRPAPRSSTR